MKAKRTTLLLGELRESLAMAVHAIAAHKLRSALTLLGVLIGVFSIIVVMTALRVMQNNIESSLSQLGINSFMIRKRPMMSFGGVDWEKVARRKDITLDMGRQLAEQTNLPQSIGIETMFWGGQVETRFGQSAPTVQVYGETPGSFPSRNWVVADGRAVTEADVDSSRDVVVLGAALAESVFPLGSPLGEKVKLNGLNYTVVGVLASKGASQSDNQDNVAIVPLTTGLSRFGRWNRSLNLLVQAKDRRSFESTMDEVRGAMRVIRKTPPSEPDDFEVISNDSLIAQFNKFTRVVRIGIAGVSSIALIAAGIGIMNIMLVSVTERTREIGIRRAVGAKKRNIMTQFILEAIMLCELGGMVGVVLGIIGGNATALFLKLPAVIPVDWAIIGLLICSVVGIVFGTYPAWKAANLDPIDSLRYE
jgi:putative ABC transport system permease protein